MAQQASSGNETDRIRLSEAMGWKPIAGDYDLKNDPQAWDGPETIDFIDDLPDPFTNANDDYAVLKWCRENLSPRKFVKFSENIANLLIGLEKKKPFDALCISLTTEYQIGFYARAALKVLE